MIALDTNVVIDIGEGPQERVETAMQAIERAGSRTGIVICGVVYAELHARQNGSAANLADILRESHIAIDFALSQEIWQSAGLAFAAHANLRRSDGGKTPQRIVADFIIGAHAQVMGSLVTRDAAFFRRAFPDLRVIAVGESE